MTGCCEGCKLKQELRASNLEVFLSLVCICNFGYKIYCYIKFYGDGNQAKEHI